MNVPPLNIDASVSLPSDETAILVVDMLNDFVTESGSLFVPQSVRTIPNIEHLLLRATNSQVPIIFIEDEHDENDPEFKVWSAHAIVGSPGANTHVHFLPYKNITVKKLRYDGFFETNLEQRLRTHFNKPIKNVIIVGTVSHICCLFTAAGAALRWFKPIIARNCISSLPQYGEFEEHAAMHFVTTLFGGQVVESADSIEFNTGKET